MSTDVSMIALERPSVAITRCPWGTLAANPLSRPRPARLGSSSRYVQYNTFIAQPSLSNFLPAIRFKGKPNDPGDEFAVRLPRGMVLIAFIRVVRVAHDGSGKLLG